MTFTKQVKALRGKAIREGRHLRANVFAFRKRGCRTRDKGGDGGRDKVGPR